MGVRRRTGARRSLALLVTAPAVAGAAGDGSGVGWLAALVVAAVVGGYWAYRAVRGAKRRLDGGAAPRHTPFDPPPRA